MVYNHSDRKPVYNVWLDLLPVPNVLRRKDNQHLSRLRLFLLMAIDHPLLVKHLKFLSHHQNILSSYK